MPYQGRLPYTYKSPYNYTLDQGTQTVPSLAFLGDTNNGLFSPATDNVAITTNGSEKLRVTNTGNVGIGTTNPTSKLSIGSQSTDRISIDWTGAGGPYAVAAIQANMQSGEVRIGAVNTGGTHFVTLYSNNSEAARITSTGNVGIGTTNPGTKLDVDGAITSRLTGASGGFRLHTNSGIVAADNVVRFFTGQTYGFNFNSNTTGDSTTPLMSITLAGNVGIGTTNPTDKLHIVGTTLIEAEGLANKGSLTIKSTDPFIRLENSNGISDNAKWDIRNIGASGFTLLEFRTINDTNTVFDTKVVFKTNGNVGIGTTNPAAKLHVAGGRIIVENTSDPAIEIRDGSGSQAGFFFHDSTYDNLVIRHADVNGENHLVLTNSGNVGIGTTNPVSGLSVTKSGTLFFADSVWMQPSGNTLITARGASGQDNWMGIGGHYYATSGSANLLLQANFGDLGSVVGHYISSTATGIGSSYFSIGRMIAGGGIGTPAAKQPQLNIDVSGNVGIGTTNPLKPLDVRGEATFGAGVLISDLNWGKDTHQLVHTFSGTAGGGNPSDGVIALVSPNANPSNTRIGSIVYGNKVSGTSATLNPGIKAVIDCYTNTNVTNAADTGANLNFYTKPDNAGNRLQMTLNSNGVLTKPYQPAFLAYRNTTLSVITTWQNISQDILTESYDVGSVYSTSTNGRFVAPVAGKYMFYAGGYSVGSSNGERYAFGVKVNNAGSPDFITGGNYCLTDTPLAPYQIVLNLAANDYVELFFFSAIYTTIGGSPHVLYWGGYLLG